MGDIVPSPRDKASAVFHCAARVGGIGHIEVDHWRNLKNAAIDWAVLDYCMATKTPLVYLSTCCVYPPWANQHALMEEDSMIEPDYAPQLGSFRPDEGVYGMAKLLGEQAVQAAVREHGLNAKIVRMFNVYGPHEIPDSTGHVIPALIGKVLRKELPLEVWGDGTQKRSYLYVDDACRGIIAALEKGKPGEVYNLGTENSDTVATLAETILAMCDQDATNIRFDTTKPSGVPARYADCSKAHRELDWNPEVSLREGLDRTIAWCKEWMAKNV